MIMKMDNKEHFLMEKKLTSSLSAAKPQLMLNLYLTTQLSMLKPTSLTLNTIMEQLAPALRSLISLLFFHLR